MKLIKNLELETYYLQEYGSADIKFNEWLKKEHIAYYKTQDNYVFSFSKPRIKTSFCFGYGYNGVSTMEGMQQACETEQYYRNNVNGFLQENLQELNKTIAYFKLALERHNINIGNIKNHYNNYYGIALEKTHINGKIANWSLVDQSDKMKLDNKQWNRHNETFIRFLTEQEIKDILQIYELIKESFIKRLNTYLKKYGLEKLNTWTYLVD